MHAPSTQVNSFSGQAEDSKRKEEYFRFYSKSVISYTNFGRASIALFSASLKMVTIYRKSMCGEKRPYIGNNDTNIEHKIYIELCYIVFI